MYIPLSLKDGSSGLYPFAFSSFVSEKDVKETRKANEKEEEGYCEFLKEAAHRDWSSVHP